MLDSVHFLLNKVISSYFLKWEGFVIKVPSVNSLWSCDWIFSLQLELLHEVHGVLVMMLIEGSGEVVQLNVQLFLSNWKWVVANFEGSFLGVSSKEVIAVSLSINLDPTTVPSVTLVIDAFEFVLSLLESTVLRYLFTVMTWISVLAAGNSDGFISLSSDLESNFLWEVIESGNNWMWALSEWEFRDGWSSDDVNWTLSVGGEGHIGK